MVSSGIDLVREEEEIAADREEEEEITPECHSLDGPSPPPIPSMRTRATYLTCDDQLVARGGKEKGETRLTLRRTQPHTR